MMESIQGYLEQGQEIAIDWLSSPAAYAQLGLLIAAYLAALAVFAWGRPRLAELLEPGEGAEGNIAKARRWLLLFLPLLLPLIAYALTAAGEQITRSLFGSGAVIALGKRVFIFIGVQ